MSNDVRSLAKRTLSPRAFHLARYIRWQGKHYFPRKAAAVFTHTAPVVTAYPSAKSDFADRIRAANLLLPTSMCRVMTWHGSDKGYVRHNYTAIYSKLFAGRRNQPLRIFELGLGTNNPALISSMGEMGMPGASLRGWRELFPHAQIYGADIDRDILFKAERIQTFYCDQTDSEAIRNLWAQPVLKGGMDIIIDDGLHTFDGNVSFLNGSLQNLRPGGIYVVEDILQESVQQWHDYLAKTASGFAPEFEFVFAELPNKFNHFDNNLLFIRRAA
jgi:SAM-dependent methyltransferase